MTQNFVKRVLELLQTISGSFINIDMVIRCLFLPQSIDIGIVLPTHAYTFYFVTSATVLIYIYIHIQ